MDEDNPDADPIPPTTLDTGDPMDEDSQDGRYYFRPRPSKRKRDQDDQDAEERQAKIIRAMITMVLKESCKEEHAFASSEIAQNYIRTYGKTLAEEIEMAFLVVLTNQTEHPEDYAVLAKVKKGITILRTYKEAIHNPKYTTEWIAAIKEELRALIANRT